jgi:hypothetical protein
MPIVRPWITGVNASLASARRFAALTPRDPAAETRHLSGRQQGVSMCVGVAV